MPAAVNGMKECSKCGETKDVSEYGKRRKNKDGLACCCKECARQQVRQCRQKYYQNNKESILARRRQYYQDNRESILARDRQYHHANRERLNEQSRQYHHANRERLNEQSRQYRQDNLEATREREKIKRLKSKAGVYEIKNRATGRIYIGQSTGWRQRCRMHRHKLSKGIHGNSPLQADYDEYGLDAFEYSVIQEYPCDTPSDVLKEHERRTLINCIREGKEIYNGIC
jgi:hypothetical protein